MNRPPRERLMRLSTGAVTPRNNLTGKNRRETPPETRKGDPQMKRWIFEGRDGEPTPLFGQRLQVESVVTGRDTDGQELRPGPTDTDTQT